MFTTASVRRIIADKLNTAGKTLDLDDHEPLFSSGRLDSLAATDLLMQLEAQCGLDLADADFDVTQIDSIAGITALVNRLGKGRSTAILG